MSINYSKFFLLLLLLVASAHAFIISDYLYSTENISAVTNETFTSNGVTYTIIRIGGTPSFLLKNGEVLTDSSSISSALTPYYISRYYPTQNELDDLKAAIINYNNSRNDGYLWKGKEEDACEDAVFLSRRDLCSAGDINCTARFLCSYLVPTGGCNNLQDQQKLFNYLSAFYNATSSTDAIIAKDIEHLESATYENIYSYLSDTKGSVPTLRENLAGIEGTLFRTPLNITACKDCLGQCPDIDLNESALDEVEKKTNTLLTKTKPLADLPSIINNITSNTAARLEYHQRGEEAEKHEQLFTPIRNEGVRLLKEANATAALVNDNDLKIKKEMLENLTREIDQKLATRNTTDINTSLEEYKILVNKLRLVVDNDNKVYNTALDAKANASALLFVLSSKRLDEKDMEEINNLKSKVKALNDGFVAGLTIKEYEDIAARYTNYTWQAKALLDKTSDNTGVIGAAKGFSRRSVNGLNYLITSYMSPSYEARESWAGYIPLLFSVVLFFSLFSLLLYIAFRVYVFYQRLLSNRMAYISFVLFFLLLTFGAVVGSATFFYFSDQITNHADFSEFQKMIYGEKNLNILLEEKDVSQGTVASMQSCAAKLKDAIGANKTITVYEMFDGSCSYNGKNTTREECMAQLNGTVIVFRYSALDLPPSFTTVFDRRAIINGDQKHFDACPLATAFRW